jgi:hypothetical protein
MLFPSKNKQEIKEIIVRTLYRIASKLAVCYDDRIQPRSLSTRQSVRLYLKLGSCGPNAVTGFDQSANTHAHLIGHVV